MWNTKDAEELLTKKNKKEFQGHTVQDEDRDKMSAPVKHESISHIDSSHKRPIGDLVWFPPGIEINNRGKLSYNPDDLQCYQFLTVAGDGQTLVWDIRYKEQVKNNPRMYNLKPEKPSKDGSVPEVVWVPLFRASLTKLEGVGELGLCQVALNMVLPKNALAKAKEQAEDAGGQWSPCISDFFCATEEGEIVFADLDPSSKVAATPSGKGGGGEVEEGHQNDSPEFVRWISQDHFRPCVTLQRSPFFPDIILSVGDWTFNVWKANVKTPIFSAPLASSYLTCGRWSPTRPGVIFIARTDGCVDVWDLSDQSHKATMSHPSLAACAITSMEFWHHNNGRQQLVAVADVSGNLHILEIPRNLWRSHNNEETIMENFFQREVRRVEYSQMRDEVRLKEKEAHDAENTNVVAETSQEDEKRAQRILEEKAEAEYRAMEAAFMEELGVPSAELTSGRPTEVEFETNGDDELPVVPDSEALMPET